VGSKIMAAAMAVLLAASVGAYASSDADTTGLDYLVLMNKQVTNNTMYSGTLATNGYDLTAYNGKAKLLVVYSGDKGETAVTSGVVVVQHANAHTGTWATVSAVSIANMVATGKVQAINVDLETLKNFVRVKTDLLCGGDSNCAQQVQAILVAPHKND